MWLLLAVSETVSFVAFEVEVIAVVEHTPCERTTYTRPRKHQTIEGKQNFRQTTNGVSKTGTDKPKMVSEYT